MALSFWNRNNKSTPRHPVTNVPHAYVPSKLSRIIPIIQSGVYVPHSSNICGLNVSGQMPVVSMSGMYIPAMTGIYPSSGFVPYSKFPYASGTVKRNSRYYQAGKFVLDNPDIPDDTDRIPQAMLSQFTVNGKNLQLKQSDYKASGGEGVVYVKGRTAYKIYHDPRKMIPVGKIRELAAIDLPNVLAPSDIIYNGSEPVGFAMPYVSDTEFLCKLFTKGYRDRNGIGHATINDIVRDMQGTLSLIHGKQILVVDYNENNFLISPDYKTVYNIDVDSYKTPSYPATAIMESIRDRKVKGNKWTEGSDWFSFGILAFQLYVGCHPFKARHPDYSPKDWMKMMDDGISVFNKRAKLPPATQTLDVIPKGHLKWFEAVFEKGDRLPPPAPDFVPVISPAIKTRIIAATDKFNITTVRFYDSDVQAGRFINGVFYALTKKHLYADGREIASFAPQVGYVASRTVKDIVNVQGDSPAIVEYNRIEAKLTYKTIKGDVIGEVESHGFFILNNCVYTVVRDMLVEICLINRGVKTTAMQQSVSNVYHNHQVFDGMVVQNMLGTTRISVPFRAGVCATLHIPELDGYRLVDGKFEAGIAIIIAEKNGQYDRLNFVFAKDFKTYSLRKDRDVDLADINFIVKDNGVCVASKDAELEVFIDNTTVKTFQSPLNNNEQLVGFKNDTYIINGDTLCKVSAK